MSGRRRAGILTASIAAALLLGAAVLGPRPTDAAFVDSEQAKPATAVTSATLQAPVVTSCSVQTLLNLGLVFTGFTLVWTSPYELTGVRMTINGVTVPASNITVGGSPGARTYTAALSYNVLGTILGSLLGSSNQVRVEAVYPGSTWVSPAATRTLTIGGVGGLLGNNSCTAP